MHNKNYIIDSLFPKPVMIVENVCLEHLTLFENTIKAIIRDLGTKATEFQNVESTHATMNNMYDVVQFSPLVKEIQNYSCIFLENLGYTEENISQMRLKNLWANISTEGHYLFPHIHSHSVISGAFYVKAGEEDNIQFYNDLTDTTFVPPRESQLSRRFVDYKCKPGRLLLFKSNLLHGNVAKKDAAEKIVMSFNVGFD